MAPNPLMNYKDDDLRVLIRNLCDTGQYDRLRQLFRLDHDGSPALSARLEEFDRTEDFSAALERAWLTSDEAVATGAPLPGDQIRYAIDLASLRTQAGNIPVALIEALVDHGVWTAGKALAYARVIPDRVKRARALTALIRRDAGDMRGTDAIQEAEAAAWAALNSDSSDGPAAAIGTAVLLAEPDAVRLVEAAIAREVAEAGSTRLAALLRHVADLPVPLLAEAEALARAQEADAARTISLSALYRRIPSPALLAEIQDAQEGLDGRSVMLVCINLLPTVDGRSRRMVVRRLRSVPWMHSSAPYSSGVDRVVGRMLAGRFPWPALLVGLLAGNAVAPTERGVDGRPQPNPFMKLTEVTDHLPRRLARRVAVAVATAEDELTPGTVSEALRVLNRLEIALLRRFLMWTVGNDDASFDDRLELAVVLDSAVAGARGGARRIGKNLRRLERAERRGLITSEDRLEFVGQMAVKVPAGKTAHAVRAAQRIGDGLKLWRCVVAYLPEVPEPARSRFADRCLKMVNGVPAESDEPGIDVLEQLIPLLTAQAAARALRVVSAIKNLDMKARLLTVLLPALRGRQRRRARFMGLRILLKSTDDGLHRALGLIRPGEGVRPLREAGYRFLHRLGLERAFHHAYGLSDSASRAEALARLVPHVEGADQHRLCERALDAAARPLPAKAAARRTASGRGADAARRKTALKILAPDLPHDLADQAVRVVRSLPRKADRIEAGFTLLPHLPRSAASQAAVDLWRLTSAGDKPLTLLRLRRILGGGLSEIAPLEEDAEKARGATRSEMLVELVTLPGDLSRSHLMRHAVIAAAQLDDPSSRVEQLSRLAPAIAGLPGGQRAALWTEMLRILSTRSRTELAVDLRGLGVLVGALGGPAAVEDACQALCDVAEWWP